MFSEQQRAILFSEEQRDILRETIEWVRHNDGQEGDESYDFTDAPAWDQRHWFSTDGFRRAFVDEVDSWVDGGQPCGTTACVAGYIVYATRYLRWENTSFSEIQDYAAWALDMPEQVAEWLFEEAISPRGIIDCLEEALKDNHW